MDSEMKQKANEAISYLSYVCWYHDRYCPRCPLADKICQKGLYPAIWKNID